LGLGLGLDFAIAEQWRQTDEGQYAVLSCTVLD
jgi:hypothetical protein